MTWQFPKELTLQLHPAPGSQNCNEQKPCTYYHTILTLSRQLSNQCSGIKNHLVQVQNLLAAHVNAQLGSGHTRLDDPLQLHLPWGGAIKDMCCLYAPWWSHQEKIGVAGFFNPLILIEKEQHH